MHSYVYIHTLNIGSVKLFIQFNYPFKKNLYTISFVIVGITDISLLIIQHRSDVTELIIENGTQSG